jgi:hypothetical protein
MSGRQFSLPAQLTPYPLLYPQADGALTSSYVTLKNSVKAWIGIYVQQTAANVPTFSLSQATNVAGGSAKAVSNTFPIWSNLDTSLTSVLTVITAAASYAFGATTKNKFAIFEILPEAVLDIANGFRTIAVVSAGSAAGNIIAANIYTYNQISAIGTSAVNILAN